jgi:hypothetical protein
MLNMEMRQNPRVDRKTDGTSPYYSPPKIETSDQSSNLDQNAVLFPFQRRARSLSIPKHQEDIINKFK